MKHLYIIVEGETELEFTGIEKILEKCPRFRAWVEKIIEVVIVS